MLTIDQLKQIIPLAGFRAGQFMAPLTAAMEEFGIDAPARQAAFLAQVAHESGSLRFVREIWNPVQCPWQARYEGRADLGNTHPGDGEKYKGRGLIQVTGRANYLACSLSLFGDERLLDSPQLLEEIGAACRSAGWFWKEHGLNEWADSGDFDGVSDLINRGHKTAKEGDSNGYADRLAFYERAREVLA